MGPATLESLVNSKPTSYQDVKDERLPFDDMFFEFSEPLRLAFPFEPALRETRGLRFGKKQKSSVFNYATTLFYPGESNIDDLQLHMEFGDNKLGIFNGVVIDQSSCATILPRNHKGRSS